MNSILDFEHKIGTTIKPRLEALNEERKNVKRFHSFFLFSALSTLTLHVLPIVGIVLAIILNLIGLSDKIEGALFDLSTSFLFSPVQLSLFFLFSISTVVFRLLYNNKKSKYKEKYKEQVVQEIIYNIAPEWYYDQNLFVEQEEYNNSEIFTTKYNEYSGDDLVTGKLDKTNFICSEVKTQHVTTTGSGKNKKTKRIHIFQGLLFKADMNKDFEGKTLIIDKQYNSHVTSGKGIEDDLRRPSEKIYMESPEFNDLFTVYSTDQVEARYLITPKIMENILKIREKYDFPVYISFTGGNIYFALSTNKDLFEPSIRKNELDLDNAKLIYDLFLLNKMIIEELNLNLRIWAKA